MKKRAQFPDSHTYLLVLRGLALNPRQEDVSKGMAVYHSMSAPNARVPPSIIHTNAMIQLCARAGDMDSLWQVASKIPDKGPSAADHITFTTILNGMREAVMAEEVSQETGEVEEAVYNVDTAKREKTVLEGKRIWEDIVGKWRAGSLQMDEDLVYAMGRILLMGTRPRDWDDVLSLIEQTMNIPRLVPQLGSPARKAEHLRQPKDDFTSTEDAEGFTTTGSSGHEFDSKPLPTTRSSKSQTPTYAKPSPKILSLIVESCTKTFSPKPAQEYWSLLTAPDTYALVPDARNINTLLRLHARSRASGKAVELLAAHLKPATATATPQQLPRSCFALAMACCSRDNKNHHVVSNAKRIVQMMRDHLAVPDAGACITYLELAMLKWDGAVMVEALAELAPVVQQIKSALAFGGRTEAAALALFRKMVGVIDTLMNRNLVPREEFAMWHQRRSKLMAFTVRREAVGGGSGGDGGEGRKKGTGKARRTEVTETEE